MLRSTTCNLNVQHLAHIFLLWHRVYSFRIIPRSRHAATCSIWSQGWQHCARYASEGGDGWCPDVSSGHITTYHLLVICGHISNGNPIMIIRMLQKNGNVTNDHGESWNNTRWFGILLIFFRGFRDFALKCNSHQWDDGPTYPNCVVFNYRQSLGLIFMGVLILGMPREVLCFFLCVIFLEGI